MTKTVSKDQIEELYRFTKTHFVEWYDVQTELVDHLANGIEQQWQTNAAITFNDALDVEFEKFGIFGFSDLVAKKEFALNKYYRSLVFIELKQYLRFPNVVFLIFAIYVLNTGLNFLEAKHYLVWSTILIMAGFSSFHVFKTKKEIKKRCKTTGKKWLLDSTVMQLGGFVHLSYLLIHILNLDFFSFFNSRLVTVIFSICTILYAVVIYISVKIVPRIMETAIRQKHQKLEV